MKSAALLLVVTPLSVSATHVPKRLLNLHGHEFLSSAKEAISPFESLAFIATFEEIPIYGGHELRQIMLDQIPESDDSIFDRLTHSVFSSIARAAKFVCSNAVGLFDRVEISVELSGEDVSALQ